MAITIIACSNQQQYSANSATNQQQRILSKGGVPQQIAEIRNDLNKAKADIATNTSNIATNKTGIDTLKKENEALKERLSAVEGKLNQPTPPSPTPPLVTGFTRAEVCRLIVRSLGLYDENAQANFKDVSIDNEYYHDIASAVNNGIINGVSEETFAPNASITRAQYATVLSRTLHLPIPTTAIAIKDVQNVNWYYNGVQAVVNAGLMDLDADGNFNPNMLLNLDINQESMKLKDFSQTHS
jgi:hypothetical protein